MPGGGPAGVVEGSEKVLLAAGVAAGVDDSAGLPNEKEGVNVAVVPAVVEPELAVVPAVPKSDGFAVPLAPPFPNEKGLEADCGAPVVVCEAPKRLGGLLAAGVFDPAAPNSVDPEFEPAPKRDAPLGALVPGVVLLLFAPPKEFDALELAVPNRGLFGVLLELFPKLNAMLSDSAA